MSGFGGDRPYTDPIHREDRELNAAVCARQLASADFRSLMVAVPSFRDAATASDPSGEGLYVPRAIDAIQAKFVETERTWLRGMGIPPSDREREIFRQCYKESFGAEFSQLKKALGA